MRSITGRRCSISTTGWSFTNGRCAISANFLSPSAAWRRRRFLFSAVWAWPPCCAARADRYGARVLINAMIWPIALYFVWHTFHGRVEGNWPEPIYRRVRHRRGRRRRTDQMGRRMGRRRALVAAACRAGWSRRRGLPLSCRRRSASFRSALPIRPRALLGAGWKELGVQHGRGAAAAWRADRADYELRA